MDAQGKLTVAIGILRPGCRFTVIQGKKGLEIDWQEKKTSVPSLAETQALLPEIEAEEVQKGKLQQLEASDLSTIRIIDDLLKVLIKKGLVTMQDLPLDVKTKILKRDELRAVKK